MVFAVFLYSFTYQINKSLHLIILLFFLNTKFFFLSILPSGGDIPTSKPTSQTTSKPTSNFEMNLMILIQQSNKKLDYKATKEIT